MAAEAAAVGASAAKVDWAAKAAGRVAGVAMRAVPKVEGRLAEAVLEAWMGAPRAVELTVGSTVGAWVAEEMVAGGGAEALWGRAQTAREGAQLAAWTVEVERWVVQAAVAVERARQGR
jgi:hypothetical protein